MANKTIGKKVPLGKIGIKQQKIGITEGSLTAENLCIMIQQKNDNADDSHNQRSHKQIQICKMLPQSAIGAILQSGILRPTPF